MTGTPNRALPRRALLRSAALGAAALPLLGAPTALAAPGTVRSGRPVLTHGVAAGDATTDGALVWARADRPARMFVDVARDASMRGARRYRGPLLTPETDGTGRLRLRGLPAGEQVHYRVVLEDPDRHGTTSEPVAGTFRTVPRRAQDVRLVWSGDVAGQGWGINPDLGGMTAFGAMADRDPDLFLHSGDTVYADGPLQETVLLPDGRTWRNLVTPEKSKVAETLAEYRGQFAYNLLDENVQRLNACTAQVVQWDDHEVTNNWYPGEVLDDARYTERRVDVLAARALRAFHEWQPIEPREAVDGRIYRKISRGPLLDVFVLDMRSYKDANGANTGSTGQVLGEAQLQWLLRELGRSRATWKVIAADLPIGLLVPDGAAAWEGVANGVGGAPSGRETEIARLLSEVKRRRITGTVWLTADVHYTAAHHYSPERAAFTDFDPFWEFVSGPLNAGAFGPNALDPTFGPTATFVHAPPVANTSPAEGFQHFGELEIDGRTAELTVTLRDGTGAALHTQRLDPPARR